MKDLEGSVEYRFQKYILENELFNPKDKILLAVSGGIDSMVMAHLFLRSNFHFGIAHCNFSLRGLESDGDENFVRNWCQERGIDFYSKRFDTIAKMQEEKISVQMAARTLRYQWFENICKENSFHYCSLAHHKNDILETILLNMVRGTGIAGLRGILPKSGIWVRPLLEFTKLELVEEARSKHIDYREDSSNLENKYTRNQLRHDVIPILEKINPNLEQTLNQHIKSLRFTELLASNRKKEIRESYWLMDEGNQKISKSSIRHFGILGSELLYTLLEVYSFTYPVCMDIFENLDGQSGARFFSKTHRLVMDRDYLFLDSLPNADTQNQTILPDQEENGLFNILKDKDPSKLDLIPNLKSQFFSLRIESPKEVERIKNTIFQPDSPKGNGLSIPLPGPNHAYFDGDSLSDSLDFRFWKDGDLFFPLGMEKPKKLSDFFIDLKIPLSQKSKIPIITYNEQIVWVAGFRPDNRFKVLPDTRSIVFLEYRKEFGN